MIDSVNLARGKFNSMLSYIRATVVDESTQIAS